MFVYMGKYFYVGTSVCVCAWIYMSLSCICVYRYVCTWMCVFIYCMYTDILLLDGISHR